MPASAANRAGHPARRKRVSTIVGWGADLGMRLPLPQMARGSQRAGDAVVSQFEVQSELILFAQSPPACLRSGMTSRRPIVCLWIGIAILSAEAAWAGELNGTWSGSATGTTVAGVRYDSTAACQKIEYSITI